MPAESHDNDWLLRMQTVGVLPGFPQVWTVATETRTDKSYHLNGGARRDRNHCLFQYTLSGSGRFRDAAREWRVDAGQGFLCEVRDPAVCYFYPPQARRPWRFMYFCFDGAPASAMLRAMVERHGPVYHLSSGAPIIRRLMGMGESVVAESGRLFADTDCAILPSAARRVARRDIVQSDALDMVQQLMSALLHAREAEQADDVASLLVRRAMEMIDRRLADNLNVSQLADYLKVSREHLTRVFHARTGRSPHDYLLRQKLLAAGTLLKESDCSIKEIAGNAGFSSPAHFNRVFRRAFGMTPQQFRVAGHIPAL